MLCFYSTRNSSTGSPRKKIYERNFDFLTYPSIGLYWSIRSYFIGDSNISESTFFSSRIIIAKDPTNIEMAVTGIMLYVAT